MTVHSFRVLRNPCCKHCPFFGTPWSGPHATPCFRCDFAAGMNLFSLARRYARDKRSALNG